MVMGSLLVGGTFVGYDLWFNKALNGEPLESVQTVYLLLDESYSAQGDESKELTYERRMLSAVPTRHGSISVSIRVCVQS
jgi:hypothetical protein